MALLLFAVALLLSSAKGDDNSTILETCVSDGLGPWSRALEDWTATTGSGRHGRIMALPQTKGYYVSDRMDTPYLSPPPPAYAQSHPPPGYASPQKLMHVPHGYKEWESKPSPPGNGKIVNRPPNKDKFAPSYPPPGHRPSIDRVDDPPRRQVSDTDLYLLSAMEKLVHRADLVEKRLRRLEESLYYALAGQEHQPATAPCPGNFTRAGSSCYSVSSEARDWKDAARSCRTLRAALLELDDEKQKRLLYAWLISDRRLRGVDFWTGGLNPGLLWIWSHSGAPVSSGSSNATIQGEGRCLSLVHDAAVNGYSYRGQDCAGQQRYICLKEDGDEIGNEIQREAKRTKIQDGLRSGTENRTTEDGKIDQDMNSAI